MKEDNRKIGAKMAKEEILEKLISYMVRL